MKKRDDRLREKLLDCAREIGERDGIEAINMRLLAKKAGIATGTVYNYFSCKDEILLALTEARWKEITEKIRGTVYSYCFYEQLEGIFGFLREQIENATGKLMGSLGKMESAGQARMASVQSDFERIIIEAVGRDKNVDPLVWDESFSKQKFAEFIMINLNISLRSRAPDIRFLTGLIKRTLYRNL